MGRFLFRSSLLFCLGLILQGGASILLAQAPCPPTPSDYEGPFYKPNVQERASTGRGFLMSGTVRTAGTCAPIPRARIEWWQANPEGAYDDAHRAVMTADPEGRYRFETDFPGRYGRRPHIHFKVKAPGHRSLTTQLYPRPGESEVTFDLVLSPN